MADSPNLTISTGGGAYIAGNVDTGGGDLAGRDIIHGYSAEQVIALIAEVCRADQPTIWDGRTPYLGLTAFQEADAEFFFGREKLVEELLIRVQQARFVCVAGPSGSGKSSLVQAGLIYALQQGKSVGSEKWLHATLTPRSDPIEQLAQAMARLAKTPLAAEYLRQQGLTNPNALHDQAETLLGNDPRQRLIVYVDQFEELFTQTKNEEQRRAFLALLTTSTQYANGRVTVIVALRADFVAQCATYPELRNLLSQQFELVGTMEPEELARAIVMPALTVGAELEPKLVEQLIADMQGEPGALPLLQFALKDLFDAQSPHKGAVVKLTLADYLQRGGIRQALERHAEHIFGELTEQQKQLARNIFIHLIEVGRGAVDTRRTATFAELVTTTADADQVDTVVQILAQARLVTVDDNHSDVAQPANFTQSTPHSASASPIPHSTTLTLAHERLIDAWPWLRRLVNENRDAIALQNELSADAKEWQNKNRNASYLYQGARLIVMCEQLTTHQITPDPLAQAFLAVSQKAHRRTRYLQVGTMLLVIGLIIATLMINQVRQGQTVQIQQDALTEQAKSNATIEARATAEAKAGATAVAARADAEREAAVARSRQLAAQSANELSQNSYEPAILLAIESGRIADTREAFTTLRTIIANPLHERTILYGHTGIVWQASWNKDESRILTASNDGTVRIWDAVTGKELVKLIGWQASWNKDESRILTASDDGAVRIWDAVTGKELVKLTGHTEPVSQATWNKDESRILTTSWDGAARIWDVATGQVLIKLTNVYGANWNPGGSRVLTNSGDRAQIWDVTTGKELIKFSGHIDKINQAMWNKDESHILTASADNTARIWDAVTGKELVRLTGHMDKINQAMWNQDESRILTSSDDGTARIWDASTGEELMKLIGHTNHVSKASWNQDESRILTTSRDHTVRIWDAATGKALITLPSIDNWDVLASKELIKFAGNLDYVLQANWNKDGSRILTSSYDNTVRIWNTTAEQELVKLTGVRIKDATASKALAKLMSSAFIIQASWNRDENRILTSGIDYTAHIWDAATGKELANLNNGTELVSQASWNQDGNRVLTIDLDNTAQIWDAITGKELIKLTGHMNGVWPVTWNKDGNLILAHSDDDKTICIWDTTTGQVRITLTGHTGDVGQARWNKDESRVLTTSWDGTARIWDATTGKELIKLTGHMGLVNQATWNQDESRILTASWDGTARIWDAAVGKELIKLADHMGLINQAIWSQDDSRILTTSLDDKVSTRLAGTTHTWDATTGKKLVTLTGIYVASWNKDGSRILTSNDDNTVRIWGSATGQTLVTLSGHTDIVSRARWNQDESRILTASDDNTARIWDAATGKELIRFTGHIGAVSQATWSKDESHILTSSTDGTVRIWYVHMADLITAACRYAPRNFTWDEWQRYMVGAYHPTCPNAPIPPDAIAAMQVKIASLTQQGKVMTATTEMQTLNNWLRTSGQYNAVTIGQQAKALATSGEITASLHVIDNAQRLDPKIEIGADTWNSLCWDASTSDQAQQVVHGACEQAVKLASADKLPSIRDSRGLARALTGDVKGALDDFKAFVEANTGTNIEERKVWIKRLEAGEDPKSIFDAATLEKLKKE